MLFTDSKSHSIGVMRDFVAFMGFFHGVDMLD